MTVKQLKGELHDRALPSQRTKKEMIDALKASVGVTATSTAPVDVAVAAVQEAPKVEEPAEPIKAPKDMSVRELRVALGARGLVKTGCKAALVERLENAPSPSAAAKPNPKAVILPPSAV